MPHEELPERTDSHQLEEESKRAFDRYLPREWTSRRSAGPDYGVDLQVDIFQDGRATALELLVQLKSSAESAVGESEPVILTVRTCTYLKRKLQVVLLVKYVRDVDEVYWLLLKDVACPQQPQQSFTVRLPKTNKLTPAAWETILEHVKYVTDKKLSANT